MLTPAVPEALVPFLRHHNLLEAAEAVLAQSEPTHVLLERWLKAHGLPGFVAADKHGYTAKIGGARVRVGESLSPISGRGDTTTEAMASLGDRVRGRTLVRTGLGTRREYRVPVDLGAHDAAVDSSAQAKGA